MTFRPAALVALLTMLIASPAVAQTPATGGQTPVRGGRSDFPAGCCTLEVLTRGLRIADSYRVAAITTRRFTHDAFWQAVAPFTGTADFRTTGMGRSLQGRSLRAVTYGTGPVKVLLWSQMHGDESTATMALADIFRFLAEARGDSLRERLRRNLTIVFVPMLNPDGAQLFQRENAAGIDINRDARRLATPEGRALKALRDSLAPDFGFNLHDQNARTRAGPDGQRSAIALLAPAIDTSGRYDEVRSRARLVAAVLARLLDHDITGRVAKYDDTFNPRAFGDLMQTWGTSTVLIESGAIADDPEKQRLRGINVAAILGALDAIGTGSYRQVDSAEYDRLPYNTGGARDVLITGGSLVLPGRPPFRADLALNYGNPVAQSQPRVADVGDLSESVAFDTVDASGLYLFPGDSTLTRKGNDVWLRLGAPAHFELRRAPEKSGQLVREVGE